MILHLRAKMVGSLNKAAGADHVKDIDAVTGAEDFSFFSKSGSPVFSFSSVQCRRMPILLKLHPTTLLIFLIDERGFLTGLKAMLNLTVDYMYTPQVSVREMITQ